MARAKDTVPQPEIAVPVSSNGRAGRGSDFVQSLERGLAVIKAFDSANPELTLSEVAREAGLTRAAARRFLLTLIDLGYVRVEGRLFALRPRVLELGYAYLSSLSLPELAQPHMEELVARIHESCSVSVLDGNEVVYVARVPTHRIMRVAISVGTRFPAFATSMGRVLLAALPPAEAETHFPPEAVRQFTTRTVTDPQQLHALLAHVRIQGYCIVDQELEEGLRSLAVPIHDGEGKVTAAMNVSMHVGARTDDEIERVILPQLLATAAEIEQDLRSGPGLLAPGH